MDKRPSPEDCLGKDFAESGSSLSDPLSDPLVDMVLLKTAITAVVKLLQEEVSIFGWQTLLVRRPPIARLPRFAVEVTRNALAATEALRPLVVLNEEPAWPLS